MNTVKSKKSKKPKKPKSQSVQASAITLVSSEQSTPPGQLVASDIGAVHRRYSDRLGQAKIGLCVGVLEVALVEHETNKYPTAWKWHAHGLALSQDPDGLTQRLRKAFPSDNAVPRPVHVKPWDGSSKWPRYCFKLDRRCRIGTDDQVRFDKRKQRPRKGRGTNTRKLTPDELLELLLLHDKMSLDGRIITKNAQLRSTSEGCRIVKLRRPRHR